jgi:hypothetical protein
MRGVDFRTPTIGADSVEHRARLLDLWETAPGLKGLLGTTDHKVIGIRYIVTAFVFLACGGIEALIMRLQLAGPNHTLLTPQQYDQLFSTHGMTMIFLYASPILSGFSPVGLLQLSVAAAAGQPRHGFPEAERVLLLDLPRQRHLSLRRISERQRAERRLVQLRSVRIAGL